MTDKKKAPVKALRDVWNEDGERIAAGSVTEVPVSLAKAWIAAGAAERADPMPGED